jgi:hypothetical protein
LMADGLQAEALREEAKNKLITVSDPVVLGSAGSLYARDVRSNSNGKSDKDTDSFIRSVLERALAKSPGPAYTDMWTRSLQSLTSPTK